MENIAQYSPLRNPFSWLFAAQGIDELTKRAALCASAFYAIGTLLINLDLLIFWHMPGLTPVRSAAIPMGAVCVAVDCLFLGLVVGLHRAAEKGSRWFRISVFLISGVLTSGILWAFLAWYFIHSNEVFSDARWNVCLGFGGAILGQAGVLLTWKGMGRNQKIAASMVLISSVAAFGYLYLYFIYPTIPLWAGGGQPAEMRIWAKDTALAVLQKDASYRADDNGAFCVTVIQSADDSLTIASEAKNSKGPGTVMFGRALRRDDVPVIEYAHNCQH